MKKKEYIIRENKYMYDESSNLFVNIHDENDTLSFDDMTQEEIDYVNKETISIKGYTLPY